MPRIQKPAPKPAPARTSPANEAAKPKTGQANAARATAGAPDDFTAELSPRPLPIAQYKTTYASNFRWGNMEVSPQVGVRDTTLSTVAEAGKPYLVDYGRIPEHIGLEGTLARATLKYRIDGGPVQSALIAEGESATAYGLRTPHRIDVPQSATGELEYWFELETTDGALHYDSNFGQNYKTNIVPAGGATLRFDDLWGETLSEPIKAGGTLRLAYDVDRIKPFLQGTYYRGAATWGAAAHVSFDGGQPVRVPLTAVRTGQYGMHVEIEPIEPAIEVPKDAKSVTIWIEGHAIAGRAWDSDHGKNYTFPVQP